MNEEFYDDVCARRCSHGGICTLKQDHDGLHDASGYCQFSEDESVADEVGDAIYAGKNPEGYAIGDSVGAWKESQ